MGVFTEQDWQKAIKVCPYTFESRAKAAEGLTMVRVLLSAISILAAEVRGTFALLSFLAPDGSRQSGDWLLWPGILFFRLPDAAEANFF
jgi:hypothetical protein